MFFYQKVPLYFCLSLMLHFLLFKSVSDLENKKKTKTKQDAVKVKIIEKKKPN